MSASFFISKFLWIPYQRLKWYGIDSLEKSEAKKFDDIYGEDCICEFDPEDDFKCHCEWNEKINLKEHKSFQDLRLVSKLGIIEKMAIDYPKSQVFIDPLQSMTRNTIQSNIEWKQKSAIKFLYKN